MHFVGSEVELDACAVRIVEEHLPEARAHLLPADVLDVVGREQRDGIGPVGRVEGSRPGPSKIAVPNAHRNVLVP